MDSATRPLIRPSLELLGQPHLDNGLLSTLLLDFDVRFPGQHDVTPQAIVLVATRQSYGDAILEMRKRTDAPAVVLLHDADVTDRVRALEGGADDVLVAPWDGSEVLARLRAVMRRSGHATSDVFTIGDLEINLPDRTIKRGARSIWLSRTELALLVALARRAGAIVPHGVLTREVWGTNESMQTVHTYVSYLRAKLDERGDAPILRTVRGVGYGLIP
ncbi:MAG: response regulator transcription factor [Candidatus Eremiobacteraeota bacterium]|nr:response regulator transcription factor [Candidatus Eremiobacteraeota bacterium]